MRDAADGKQADQSDINNAVMGKMVYMLPVFMLFVMVSLPGAIAVYYAVNTLCGYNPNTIYWKMKKSLKK